MRDGYILVAIGLAGFGFAVRAVRSGEVTLVWSRLGGWATLASRASRIEQPVLFWGTTLFYGGGGLLLAGYGVYRLLQPAT